jgi:hypothetical protein
MKKYALTLIAAVILSAMPVMAQQDVSRTYTEAEVNSAYRVDNPFRGSVSNVFVDLQNGQVQISYTYTRRSSSVDVISTLAPYVEGGRVYWQVNDIATVNGSNAPDELIEQINNRILSSWRNYLRGRVDGVINSVVVTDTDITITGTLDGSRLDEVEDTLSNAVEEGNITEDDTPRLWQLFTRVGSR